VDRRDRRLDLIGTDRPLQQRSADDLSCARFRLRRRLEVMAPSVLLAAAPTMTLASRAPRPLVSEYLPRPDKYIRSAGAEAFCFHALLRRGRVQRRERRERGGYGSRRSRRNPSRDRIRQRRGRLVAPPWLIDPARHGRPEMLQSRTRILP
jgi:hypothetical protein